MSYVVTRKPKFKSSKAILGHREITITNDTWKDIELIPNFSGSQRGCVVKKTNKKLKLYGIFKKSQVHSINNVEVHDHIFNAIKNFIADELQKLNQVKVKFSIPIKKVDTCEITLKGPFPEKCIGWVTQKVNSQNLIINSIDNNTEFGTFLIKKCKINVGWRISHIKHERVLDKKYFDIAKALVNAGNDSRVEYSIIFEEGLITWYDVISPTKSDINTNNNGSNHKRKNSISISVSESTKRGSYDAFGGSIVVRKRKRDKKKRGHHKSNSSMDSIGSRHKRTKSRNLMETDNLSLGVVDEAKSNKSFASKSMANMKSSSRRKLKDLPVFSNSSSDLTRPNSARNTTKKRSNSGADKSQSNVQQHILKLERPQSARNSQMKNYSRDKSNRMSEMGRKAKKPVIKASPKQKPPAKNENNDNNNILRLDKDIIGDLDDNNDENTLVTPNSVVTSIESGNEIIDDVGITMIDDAYDNNDDDDTFGVNPDWEDSVFGGTSLEISQPPKMKDKSVSFNIDAPLEVIESQKMLLTEDELMTIKDTLECDICDTKFDVEGPDIILHKLNSNGIGICIDCIKDEYMIQIDKLDGLILIGCHINGNNIVVTDIHNDIYNTSKIIYNDDESKNNVKLQDILTENAKILQINDVDITLKSYNEIISLWVKLDTNIKLKIQRYYTNIEHRNLVDKYKKNQKEIELEQTKVDNKKKIKTRDPNSNVNINDFQTESDIEMFLNSDSDYESGSSTDEETRKRRKKSRTKSKSKKKKRTKTLTRLTAITPNNNDDDNESVIYKTPKEILEENEGMIYIKEAKKYESSQQWALAVQNYEKALEIFESLIDSLTLNTRDKREFRNILSEYRKNKVKNQNQIIRSARSNFQKNGGNGLADIIQKAIESSKDSDVKGSYSTNKKKTQDNNNNNNDNNNSNNNDNNDSKKDDKKKSDDPDDKFRQKLEGDIVTEAPNINFSDVTGLLNVKLALYECVILPQKRPEFFTGLRKPSAGLLLFGPPGNGKTMIAKCIATECDATFFSISASSITSNWVGEAERTMRTLFKVARERAPSIIFIDEVDSLLTARGSKNEAESSRRIKTEFLIQFDGVKAATETDKTVLVIGATNLPGQLDEAVLRRFGKRILVPVPDNDARYGIFRRLMKDEQHNLNENDFRKLVNKTELYSASDLTNVCKDAVMGPLRDLGAQVMMMDDDMECGPVTLKHFESSLNNVRASVKQESLDNYNKWDKQFGSKLTFPMSALPETMHAAPIEPLPEWAE